MPFWGLNNKDSSLLRSILGSPVFGNCHLTWSLPCTANGLVRGLQAAVRRRIISMNLGPSRFYEGEDMFKSHTLSKMSWRTWGRIRAPCRLENSSNRVHSGNTSKKGIGGQALQALSQHRAGCLAISTLPRQMSPSSPPGTLLGCGVDSEKAG